MLMFLSVDYWGRRFVITFNGHVYDMATLRPRGMLTSAVMVILQPAPESDATPEHRRSGMPAQAEGYATK